MQRKLWGPQSWVCNWAVTNHQTCPCGPTSWHHPVYSRTQMKTVYFWRYWRSKLGCSGEPQLIYLSLEKVKLPKLTMAPGEQVRASGDSIENSQPVPNRDFRRVRSCPLKTVQLKVGCVWPYFTCTHLEQTNIKKAALLIPEVRSLKKSTALLEIPLAFSPSSLDHVDCGYYNWQLFLIAGTNC